MSTKHPYLYEPSDYSLAVGALISVIIHVVFLLYLLLGTIFRTPEARVFEVSLEEFLPPPVKRPPPAQNQIVSDSKAAEQSPPPDTFRLSQRDQSTEHEQIKRGLDNAGPVVGPKSTGMKAPVAKPKPQERDSPHKELQNVEPKKELSLSDLKLDQKTLIKDFVGNSSNSKTASEGRASRTQAFSRPLGSGALFHGNLGSSDFLPNLPDGDITLLNAKASKFAVFVRRVAIQVFSQMRTQGWDLLSASDISRITGNAQVTAILSPKGELLSVKLDDSSSSLRFDEVLEKAVKKGAKDPNPPEAAKASDGNYHFIFQARSWVQMSSHPRGGMAEQRWLLLSTGLD